MMSSVTLPLLAQKYPRAAPTGVYPRTADASAGTRLAGGDYEAVA
jgi:hypothetical protein